MNDARRPSGSRRGFAFITVLALLLIATIAGAAMMQRATTLSLATERQIEAYHRHSELMGVRDIVHTWLGSLGQRELNDLREMAQDPLPDFTLRLDDQGSVINVYARDGQGTIPIHFLAQASEVERVFLMEVLEQLPPDRPDLVRRVGYKQISLRAAPDEVLMALARGRPEVAEVLISSREKGHADSAPVMQEAARLGVETADIQPVLRWLTFAPHLFQLDVEVTRQGKNRRYTVLALQEGNLPRMLEWRAEP